jgi:hypothetical protein
MTKTYEFSCYLHPHNRLLQHLGQILGVVVLQLRYQFLYCRHHHLHQKVVLGLLHRLLLLLALLNHLNRRQRVQLHKLCRRQVQLPKVQLLKARHQRAQHHAALLRTAQPPKVQLLKARH